MELTGRTYIFFAATLLLLAGTFEFYDAQKEASAEPGMVVTRAEAVQNCDRNSISTSSTRIGCRHDTGDARVRKMPTTRTSLTGSGAKFVSATN